jgi:uncharacterized membrane protein
MFFTDKNSKNSQPQISVLPPLFHQANAGSQSQKPVPVIEASVSVSRTVKSSRKSRFILSLYKLGLYGFWFGIGVGAANITRLFPSGWIVYLALMGSAAGTIMLVKPADVTEEMLSLRRISGLALVISVVALWDGLIVTANLPITIGLWVFPAWLVAVCAIAFLIGAFVTLTASNQGR